jgi:hypothetical protein
MADEEEKREEEAVCPICPGISDPGMCCHPLALGGDAVSQGLETLGGCCHPLALGGDIISQGIATLGDMLRMFSC